MTYNQYVLLIGSILLITTLFFTRTKKMSQGKSFYHIRRIGGVWVNADSKRIPIEIKMRLIRDIVVSDGIYEYRKANHVPSNRDGGITRISGVAEDQ